MLSLPPHKCGLYLEHNANRDVYQTVAEWLEGIEAAESGLEWSSPDRRQLAIDENEIWTMCWYPDTPVGNHFIAAPTLDELLRFAASYPDSGKSTEARPSG